MAESAKPIIIIKKKGGHGGHHGGAWKVAYADFVTAMMALFIVLWLLNSSKKVQEAVGGYFKDPTGSSRKVGNNQSGSGQNFTLTKDDMPKLKDELQKAVRHMADFEKFKNQVEMTITPEGLRIELLESDAGTFFESGSAKPSSNGTELLTMLSHELGGLPNRVMVEGHTDSKPYVGARGYGNWELSADRANSARRWMQANGLRTDQISQVRGYADQALRIPTDPLNASNRRITLIVQYSSKEPEDDKVKEEPAGKEGGVAEKPSPEKTEKK